MRQAGIQRRDLRNVWRYGHYNNDASARRTRREGYTVRIADLPEWIEREFEFPTTRATVVERFGGMKVDAPDHASSESLSTILERGGAERYRSSTELMEVISGSLSDVYIGRKYYDDRGHNPTELVRGNQEEMTDSSF